MRNCSPVCPSNVLRRTPLYYNSDSFVCLYLLLYGGQLIYFFSFHLFLQRILNTWCTMCRLCSELSQHVRCCSTNSHNFFPPPNWCPILLLSLLPPKVTLPRGREPATSCPTFGSFLSLGQPQKLGRGNDASSALSQSSSSQAGHHHPAFRRPQSVCVGLLLTYTHTYSPPLGHV